MSDTKSDRGTDVGDADDVLIVHDGTKRTHLESTQLRSKRKHDEEPGPIITVKGAKMTSPASPKCSMDTV